MKVEEVLEGNIVRRTHGEDNETEFMLTLLKELNTLKYMNVRKTRTDV